MRIAMIGSRGLHSNYGGIERVMDELCPRLCDLGHAVDVFSRAGLSSDDGNGLRALPVASFGGKHFENLSRSVLSTLKALHRYDVLHFHATGPGILSGLTKLTGQPSLVTIHALDHRREKWGWMARQSLQLAERVVLACADEITAVSGTIQHYLQDRYGRKITHIANGLPQKERVPAGEFLQSHGLEAGGYFLFASRLTPEKGCHDLIEAFNGIESRYKLVVAGGVGPADYVESLARQADPSKVIFLGHLEGQRFAEVFSNAKLFVLPSYIEGMSMALLESVAFGIPALVSDIAENISVVGDAAFRFPVGDIPALRRMLTDLSAAPELVGPLREESSAMPCQGWDKIAEQYDSLYRSVTASRSTASAQAAAATRSQQVFDADVAVVAAEAVMLGTEPVIASIEMPAGSMAQ